MCNFPPLHQRLISLGVFDRLNDPDDWMSLYDVKFPRSRTLDDYLGEDRVVDVLPFAVTAAGDVWGYLCSKLPDAPVACFYHDEAIAQEVAKDIECFFILQLVESAMHSTNEQHTGVERGWTRSHLLRMCNALSCLLSSNSRKTLDKLRGLLEASPEVYDVHPLAEAAGLQLVNELKTDGYTLTEFEWQKYQ